MKHYRQIISGGNEAMVRHWSINGKEEACVPCTPTNVFSITVNNANKLPKVRKVNVFFLIYSFNKVWNISRYYQLLETATRSISAQTSTTERFLYKSCDKNYNSLQTDKILIFFSLNRTRFWKKNKVNLKKIIKCHKTRHIEYECLCRGPSITSFDRFCTYRRRMCVL